ncbi:hypothetical protein GQ55_5G264100 [Panicum hallii var. hallii]|uniref:Uncharacterized protein n=1 Tax=Panicum hallii var. hallii TaxID=1504633 RepID=A0A2T7DKD5_9POAL|nr:hypothetical protein GQ55_5G264100 [Panicum hallii var. hallii]
MNRNVPLNGVQARPNSNSSQLVRHGLLTTCHGRARSREPTGLAADIEGRRRPWGGERTLRKEIKGPGRGGHGPNFGTSRSPPREPQSKPYCPCRASVTPTQTRRGGERGREAERVEPRPASVGTPYKPPPPKPSLPLAPVPAPAQAPPPNRIRDADLGFAATAVPAAPSAWRHPSSSSRSPPPRCSSGNAEICPRALCFVWSDGARSARGRCSLLPVSVGLCRMQ